MDLKTILEEIEKGKTLYITNYLRCTKINQKTVLSWRKIGREVLRQGKSGSLYVASGKKYLCIDGNGLTLVGA